MIVKRVCALLVLAACAAAPAALPPPLGVSMSESRDSAQPAEPGAPTSDAGALAIERVDACSLPAYIPNDAAGPAVIEDVAYATDDHRQKYDLALPASSPKALVVIVHGGGWTSGGKRLFRPTIRMLATEGYAAASVGYRLASSSSKAFPASLEDVRCAIRAVAERVGARKTIILGASAGAHLAAMAALTRDAPDLDGDCADRRPLHIDGAILYYAPLSLDRARERYIHIMRQAVDELLYGVSRVAAGVDEDAGDWAERAARATPEHFVHTGAPPMLLVHGEEDNIVPAEDARDFAKVLERDRVPHLLLEIPGQKHGFPVLARGGNLTVASCTMMRFLSQIASE